MPAFNGQLRPNSIFAALFNMIISQQVFADNIAGTEAQLVSKARVDGTLYGDTKLYYSTQTLYSAEWGKDAEAANLLQLHRPKAPEVQAIVMDKYRQIKLTIDNYLTKQAWIDEGSFASFNAVMLGWMGDTKRVYDSTTYNAFFGTAVGATAAQTYEIALSDITQTGEEGNRLKAQTIAARIADLLDELEDIHTVYNDYGHLRSYDRGAINIVWNKKWLNTITKLDLPTIFHDDGIMEKFSEGLNAKYFGEINADATAGNGTTVRSLIEQFVPLTAGGGDPVHVFAGQLIPTTCTAPAGTSYTQDDDVICKVFVKYPPMMSAFSVGTSFFNAASLTENHYLTWGHNTLEYLKNYPFITVHAD